MKTIETTAAVDQKGKLTIELTSDLPPENHRAVNVVDEASSSQEISLSQTEATGSKTTPHSTATETAWTVLRNNAGTVEMPEDWAKEHAHYLYSTLKRKA